MKKTSIYAIAGALLAFGLSCGAASAQNMKPGQWELKNKISSADGTVEKAMAMAQQQMAAMAPEQRKAIEDMMAKSGASLSSDGGAISVKVCITQKMAEQNTVPMQQQQHGDCKSTNSAMQGNTMKIAFTCTKPPSSGEGEVTFTSNTAYTMKMAVTSTAGDGKAKRVSIDSQGKWLGATCTMPAQ